MKKLFLTIAFFTLCLHSWGKEIVLIKNGTKNFPDQIPVNVDVTDKILNIIITGNFEAEVIVTGPDGVVYQSRINAKTITP